MISNRMLLFFMILSTWAWTQEHIVSNTVSREFLLKTNTTEEDLAKESMHVFSNYTAELEQEKQQLGRLFRKCTIDSDCRYEGFYTWQDSKCIRKPILAIHPTEIIGYVLIFISMLLSNIAGMGGSFFSVTILYEFFKFEFQKASGYAAFLNMLVAILRFVYYFKTKHPNKPHQTLVDYETVVIMLPLGILGIFIGDIFYKVLPFIVIALLLGIMLFWISTELVLRGYWFWKSESGPQTDREVVAQVGSFIFQIDKVTLHFFSIVNH